jgi:hypothetical protein
MSATSTWQSIYRDIFSARAQAAIAMAKAVKTMPHGGTLGEMRETLVRDPFRPFLPADIGVGTGHLIDHTGEVSPQNDIILFDRSLAPPVMLNENLGLFPIESCLYVIEVKSKLTLDELRQCHFNALALRRLSYRHQPCGWLFARYLLFAFGSDLVESENGYHKNECSRYQRLYITDNNCVIENDTENSWPPIRALCVVGKEYGQEVEGKWQGLHADNAGREILAFIGGITNTYRSISKSRNPIWMEDYFDMKLCNMTEYVGHEHRG